MSVRCFRALVAGQLTLSFQPWVQRNNTRQDKTEDAYNPSCARCRGGEEGIWGPFDGRYASLTSDGIIAECDILAPTLTDILGGLFHLHTRTLSD